jgi:hypothetical protein
MACSTASSDELRQDQKLNIVVSIPAKITKNLKYQNNYNLFCSIAAF